MAENQEMTAFEAFEFIALAISDAVSKGVIESLERLQEPEGFQELVADLEGLEAERRAVLESTSIETLFDLIHDQFTGLDSTLTWHNRTAYKRYPDTVKVLPPRGTPMRFAIELHHTLA